MEEPNIKPQLKMVAIYYCGEALGNAEKSCVMAGYSPRYARGNAYKIVMRKDVQQYIKYLTELNKQSLLGHIATVQEIQHFWTTVMDSGDCKVSDRLRASELLAKAQGAFENEW